MKKSVLFSGLIFVVGILLFLLKATGMKAHIVLSVVGLALLVAYTLATKKEWKKPVLEILMRVFYAVALISGAVMMNVRGVAVLSVMHKISAALFVILFIVLFVLKVRTKAE